MQEKTLAKAMADLENLMSTHGEEVVLAALADLASDPTLAEVLLREAKGGIGSPAGVAKALLDLLIKSASVPGKLAVKTGAAAMDKAIDQDVHISSQGPVLKVTDPELKNLLIQTNKLIANTNNILMGAADALEGSEKELQDIEYSMDDFIAGTSGDSVDDVNTRQAAGLPMGKKLSDEDPERRPERA